MTVCACLICTQILGVSLLLTLQIQQTVTRPKDSHVWWTCGLLHWLAVIHHQEPQVKALLWSRRTPVTHWTRTTWDTETMKGSHWMVFCPEVNQNNMMSQDIAVGRLTWVSKHSIFPPLAFLSFVSKWTPWPYVTYLSMGPSVPLFTWNVSSWQPAETLLLPNPSVFLWCLTTHLSHPSSHLDRFLQSDRVLQVDQWGQQVPEGQFLVEE